MIPIEEKRKDIGKMVSKELEPGTGFVIVFFEFRQPTINNYLTNGQHNHMIQAMASIIEKLAGQKEKGSEGQKEGNG